MTNEYKYLTDFQVLQMYEQAIIACRQAPRIMPKNDRDYLHLRKIGLRDECIRRGLLCT